MAKSLQRLQAPAKRLRAPARLVILLAVVWPERLWVDEIQVHEHMFLVLYCLYTVHHVHDGSE